MSPKLQHFQGCDLFYVFNDGFFFLNGGFAFSSNGFKRLGLLVLSIGANDRQPDRNIPDY